MIPDDEFARGVRAAAEVAGSYDGSSTHDHRLEDCILHKLNATRRRRPRRNAKRVEDPKHAWFRGLATGLSEMNRRLIGGDGADAVGVRTAASAAGLTLSVARASGVSDLDLAELRRAGVT